MRTTVIRTPEDDAEGLVPASVAAGKISRFRTVACSAGVPVFGV